MHNNFKRKSLEELERIARRAFSNSMRKHLLITGSIGMGKTTLLNYLIKDLANYTKLTSYLYGSHEGIKLHDSISGKKWIIGQRSGKGMVEKDDFFNTTGLALLENHLNSKEEIFIMDEIGRLEKGKKEYLEMLNKIFREKNVIATMCRDDNALYGNWDVIENSLIIDLDTINSL